jgi:probable rRNA maturation factor
MADGDSRGRPSAAAKPSADRRSANREGRSGPPAARRSAVSGLRTEVVGERAPGLARWLASVAPAKACGDVTVAIVPDTRVRLLNRQYRRKDTATDVLSFPSGEKGYLGDIVIAAGVARRQAREAGHPVQTELRVLALHGLLHLLGYDHERDGGLMARLERRLRRKGGLVEGLIERGIERGGRDSLRGAKRVPSPLHK